VRDSATNTLKSRFGMGPDIEAIIAGKFAIGLKETKDVFQAAVAEGVDVFIENVNAESIRRHIPDAYRSAIPARAFALFPITIKGAPIGLFYGDADAVGAIRFSAEELSLLKTLRNQAVIAIRQTA
jgi:GAF domain-containing protein